MLNFEARFWESCSVLFIVCVRGLVPQCEVKVHLGPDARLDFQKPLNVLPFVLSPKGEFYRLALSVCLSLRHSLSDFLLSLSLLRPLETECSDVAKTTRNSTVYMSMNSISFSDDSFICRDYHLPRIIYSETLLVSLMSNVSLIND